MRHFADEEWADFARTAADSEQRERIQRHLDEGCRRCARTLRVWREVGRIASAEAAYQPPASAVRQIRGLYGIRKRSSLRRVTDAARLLFDSALGPLPVGVRGAAAPARQLVFGDRKRIVKVQIEKGTAIDQVSLLGQLVDQKSPRRRMENHPVLVRSGRQIVERTLTNSLGEFELAFELTPRVRLQVGHGIESLLLDLGAHCVGSHSGESRAQLRMNEPSPLRGEGSKRKREASRAGSGRVAKGHREDHR